MDTPASRLRAAVSPLIKGSCKMLSQGDACLCPLCDLDRMREALRWYAGEAKAIHKNMQANHDMAVLASVSVLSLDDGGRAAKVLGE